MMPGGFGDNTMAANGNGWQRDSLQAERISRQRETDWILAWLKDHESRIRMLESRKGIVSSLTPFDWVKIGVGITVVTGVVAKKVQLDVAIPILGKLVGG